MTLQTTTKLTITVLSIIALITIDSFWVRAGDESSPKDLIDAKLIDDYINSKGYSSVISFDASNIKQFWIDKSVVSKNNSIYIALNSQNIALFGSVPLKIQLANVNWRQDCRIDVITDSQDINFSVLNDKSRVLCESSTEQDFIQHHVLSSTFHIEDTQYYDFYLKFTSKSSTQVLIKRIILSFSENPNGKYLVSPGVLNLARDNSYVTFRGHFAEEGFKVIGTNSQIHSSKNIIISNNKISTSVKVKNTGDAEIRVYVGFSVFTKEKKRIDVNNYPYNGLNQILTVIASEKGSDKVIVDSLPQWTKNCLLALNAKDDLSDLPNFSFVNGRISKITQLPDGHAEITMDEALKEKIETGMRVRVHGGIGTGLLYTTRGTLQPGEEKVFNSSVQKDDNAVCLSSDVLAKGTYYVEPVLLSYSVDSNKENTVIISDYTISY